jgi:hypothetical protein
MRRGQLLERKPAHARRIADPVCAIFMIVLATVSGVGWVRSAPNARSVSSYAATMRSMSSGPNAACCNKL